MSKETLSQTGSAGIRARSGHAISHLRRRGIRDNMLFSRITAPRWNFAAPSVPAGLTEVQRNRPQSDGVPADLESPRISLVVVAGAGMDALPDLSVVPEHLHQVCLVTHNEVNAEAAAAMKDKRPNLEIIGNARAGKGNALASGFSAATGDIIIATECVDHLNGVAVDLLVNELRSSSDVATLSRESSRTVAFRTRQRARAAVLGGIYRSPVTKLKFDHIAFWRDCLPYFGLDRLLAHTGTENVWGDGREVDTLLVTRAIRGGLKVTEVTTPPQQSSPMAPSLPAGDTAGWRELRAAVVERFSPQQVVVEPRASRSTHTLTAGVVICAFTEDRLSDMDAAVESLRRQTRRPDEVILVIDHNEALLQEAVQRYPDIRVVPNSHTKGLSGGRNTAIGILTSDVIAFLDDDAVAEPAWLDAMVAEMEADESVWVVGGHTSPAWSEGQPAWWPAEFDWAVGATYRGTPTKVHEVRNPFGGNAAFRRKAFESAGTFTEGVGRLGKDTSGGEETELAIRIRQRNPQMRIVYTPHAVIHHRVRAERATVRYLARRCLGEGRSKAKITELVGTHDATSRELDYTRRILVQGVVREALLSAATLNSAGIRRAGAICIGLGSAATGFGQGKARQLRRRKELKA